MMASLKNSKVLFSSLTFERLFMLSIGMMVSCTIRGSIGYATAREGNVVWNMQRNDTRINSTTRTHFSSTDNHFSPVLLIENEPEVRGDRSSKLGGDVVNVANRTWPIAPQHDIIPFRSWEELLIAGAMLAICTSAIVIVSVAAFLFVMSECGKSFKKALPSYNSCSTADGLLSEPQRIASVLEVLA